MTDVDNLVMVDLIAMREKAMETVQRSHPHILSIANAILSGKKNRVGMEVTAGGKSIGQYTLHLDGIKVTHAEPGKLDPSLHHPILGTIRVYCVVEREALERMLSDQDLIDSPFAAMGKYLPDLTIKFLP
jgi:hypothetical protein